MIVTVTLNPAVDKTIVVRSLTLGDINQAQESCLDPAGKGINVSRLVHRLQWPTIALGFVAGGIGHLVEGSLAAEGVQHQFVHIGGETRLNVTIMDATASIGTSLRDRGPAVTQTDLAALEHHLERWLRTCRVVVFGGSLPPGVPNEIYATYVHRAQSAGAKAILDTHGEALRYGISARPCLIKPNISEAEELLGRPLPDLPAVAAAATELVRQGAAEVVVISMGAEGSVCYDGTHLWLAVPPPVQRRSTVGSGDSMVGGLAIAVALGQSMAEGLRLGTAAGAATAMTPGTSQGSQAEIDALLPRVRVERLANDATP